MSYRLIRVWLVAMLVMLTLTGCVVPEALMVQPPEGINAPPPAPAPQDSSPNTSPDNTAAISPHLAAALAHAPASTTTFSYTDWSFLKRVAGVPNLSRADSWDDQMAFMRRVGVDEQAIASGFGLNYFLTHAETWGWDSLDLVWEANLSLDGPPAWVLRFHDDFDFAPFFALLDEREYVTSEHGGVPIYSHALDFDVDWIPSTEFAILNIAYLAEEKSLILSSNPETVTATLDAIAAGETLAAQPAMRSVAAAMGEVGAAIVVADGCTMMEISDELSGSPELAELVAREVDEAGITYAYDVFGFGYGVGSLENGSRGEDSRGATNITGDDFENSDVGSNAEVPVGIFVHHYADATHAEADLEPRRQVATSASSLTIQRPYAELFEVVDAQVVADDAGANVVLYLHAIERPPRLFLSMIYQRDLLFSACGSGDSG